jgi:hypothetical protein
MARTSLALLSLLLVLGGCKADHCRDAFQLEVVLPGGVDGSRVTVLAIAVDAAGLHKTQDLPITGQLAGGRTTVAVDVGAQGKAEFSADVAVEARDATGRVLARGQQRFTGMGDACYIFTLALGGGSDARPSDARPDGIRDLPPVKPGLAWSKRFGAAANDEGHRVAVDASGNVVVTGFFRGIVDFGGGPLTAATERDMFVASYGATGAFRWSKRLGSAFAGSGLGVAVDAQGGVVVTGGFYGSVDFGGGPLTAKYLDIFVASYTSTGAYRWVKDIGTYSPSFGRGVAIDGSGNVIITGSFMGVNGANAVDFGGGPLTGVGASDIFVASYGPTGAFRWAKRFGQSSFNSGQGVAVDGNGNVTVTGDFCGTVDFGGGPLTSAGLNDIFVASYSSTGAFRWAKRFGTTSKDQGWGVAVDGTGNVTITGAFNGTVDFGGGPLSSPVNGDIFIASYSSTGAFRWARRLGATTDDDWGYAVAVDGSGNVTVAGVFSGTVDFGGGPLATAGGNDIFVASYSATGSFRWARRFGATGIDRGHGVAVAGSGNVAVTGSFEGTVDFGGGPLTSAGSSDIFLLELAP